MTELFRNWPDDSVAIADEVLEWAPAAMHCVAIGTKRTYRGDLLFCPLSGVKRTWPKNGVMSAYDAVAHTPGQKGNRDCAQLWLDTVKLSTVNRWGTWGDSGTSRRVGNTVGLGNGFLERHWLSCNDARSMSHTLFCSSCELLTRITARLDGAAAAWPVAARGQTPRKLPTIRL
jgi:hypothetical protein